MSGDVYYANGSHFVEWYRDDDDNSGQGANPRYAHWWGSREECQQMAKGDPPPNIEWVPVVDWNMDTSPGSAAWCETNGDNR